MSTERRRNISSPLRTGFDYQTVWAFRFCFELLSNPEKFKWIHLETTPDEYPEGEAFFLDDIVIRHSDDKVGMYQVKITADWSFEELFNQEKNKKGNPKDSLIQKWSKSFFKYEGQLFEAALITIGTGDTELSNFVTTNGLIDSTKLQKEKPFIFERFVDQIGTEEKAKKFLDAFQFRFGQPDIDALESETREHFFEALRATASGTTNLLLELHKEIRKELTRPLSIETIRNLCEFDRPRHLNQEFAVPADFQVFDANMHADLVKEIQNNNTGIQVFVGNPGAGKSTYLSKLTEDLQAKQTVVIRHHYHIAPGDQQPVERLRAERVIEGLKAQLKDQRKLIGKLALQDSRGVSVSEFLASLAEALCKQGKSAVVIIDGLDHAVRHGFDQDLKKALQDICSPQPGLWFLFGLQPAAKSYLPESIVNARPERNWVQVPGLDKFSVVNLVKKNETGLQLPNNDHGFREFCDKVYQVSQGNPLHLRYTLASIKNRNADRSVSSHDCERLLPYTGDIESYYRALWRGLPSSGKTALISLSLIDTKLHAYNLKELISTFDTNPAVVTTTFNDIRHLLKSEATGLSIYHNSFEEFLKRTPEFCDQKVPTQKALLRWVQSTSDDFIKWAELAKLEYQLGNPNLLLSLNYNWVIDGLRLGRPAHLMLIQLREASKAALKAMSFSKLLLYSYLSQYLDNTIQFNSEAFESAWALSLYTHNAPITRHRIDNLTEVQAEALATLAHFQKETELFEQIFKNLNERNPDQRFGNKGDVAAGRPTLTETLIKIASLDGEERRKSGTRYLKSYRDSGWSADLFGLYAEHLIKNGFSTSVESLLQKDDLTEPEIRYVEKQCVLFDLRNSGTHFQKILGESKSGGAWTDLYKAIKGPTPPKVLPPQNKSYPREIAEHDSSKQEEMSHIYVEIFLKSVVASLSGDKTVATWRSQLPPRWPFPFIDCLVNFSEAVANKIRSKQEIIFEDFFNELAKLVPLRWPSDREILTYQRAIPSAIREVLIAVDAINRQLKLKAPIAKDRLERLVSGELFFIDFFDRDKWLSLLLSISADTLSDEAIDWYLEWDEGLWKDAIVSFNERSTHYSRLGQLARKYGKTQSQKSLLDLACRNLISYGYHKDMFLDEVTEALTSAAHLKPNQFREWAIQLDPIVQNIGEYTDGDETGHVPKIFVDLLGKIEPALAINYYRHLVDKEDFYLADSVFARILKFINPSTPIGSAICATAIDDEPYSALKELSAEKPEFQKPLQSIHDYVGELPKDREREASRSQDYSTEDKEDYSAISESALDKRLEKEVTPWLQTGYVFKWALHNVKHGALTEARAVQILLGRVAAFDDHEIEDKLLDYLYPRLLTINAEESFRLLCLAQQNGNGWSKYWGNRSSEVSERWAFLKKHFPHRIDEFYQRSLKYKYDTEKVLCPIDRAVDFFIEVGKPRRALELLGSAVDFTKLLMANLQLPVETWFNSPNTTETTLLFLRLDWPSPPIRERAATGIGSLIKSGELDPKVVFQWMGEQALETKIVTALLALQKAASLGHQFRSEELLPHIKKSSLAIEKVFKNICFDATAVPLLKAKEVTARLPPKDYEPSEFFSKHITGFLPPFYFNEAVKISGNCGFDFVRDWAFESDQIIAELGVKEQIGSAERYMSGYENPILSFSPKLSEIYKSAFTRVLRFYSAQKRLPKEWTYTTLSDKTVPVDLSFWQIAPQKSPQWWPQNAEPSSYSDYQRDLVTFSIDGKLATLPRIDGKVILGLDGAVKPKEGWLKGIPRTRVCVISFLYSVDGPKIPTAEEILAEIEYLPDFVVPPSEHHKTISFLEAPGHATIERTPKELGDTEIFPLLGRVHQDVINIWQCWRGYHHAFTPTRLIGKCVGVKRRTDSWEYIDDKEFVIGSASEWIEGLSERAAQSFELQHGSYFSVDETYLNSFIEKSGLRLAHVVQFSHKTGSNRREERKIVKETYLYGLSPLII